MFRGPGKFCKRDNQWYTPTSGARSWQDRWEGRSELGRRGCEDRPMLHRCLSYKEIFKGRNGLPWHANVNGYLVKNITQLKRLTISKRVMAENILAAWVCPNIKALSATIVSPVDTHGTPTYDVTYVTSPEVRKLTRSAYVRRVLH